MCKLLLGRGDIQVRAKVVLSIDKKHISFSEIYLKDSNKTTNLCYVTV